MKRLTDGWLFAENATVHDVVETQRRGLERALREMTAAELRSVPVEELTAALVERFRLDAPTLDRSRTVEFPLRKSTSMYLETVGGRS